MAKIVNCGLDLSSDLRVENSDSLNSSTKNCGGTKYTVVLYDGSRVVFRDDNLSFDEVELAMLHKSLLEEHTKSILSPNMHYEVESVQ